MMEYSLFRRFGLRDLRLSPSALPFFSALSALRSSSLLFPFCIQNQSAHSVVLCRTELIVNLLTSWPFQGKIT